MVELDDPQAAVITQTGKKTTAKRKLLRKRDVMTEEKRASMEPNGSASLPG
jgi:hypothetical protein